VQLINADDGFHVFSENYDRTLEDIFAVQDEIATYVVNALRVRLLGEQPKADVVDAEVYALYLKGRYFNNLKGKENWENAAGALKEALEIDPSYAPAWSELSTTYRFQANNALLERDEGIKLARDAAEKALALDENLASAWISLSYVKSLGDWDWAGAEEAVKKASELAPRNADVLNGIASIATILGRSDEAISALEAAVDLDPLNQSALNGLGLNYMYADQFDQAESTFRQLLQLNPQYPWAHTNLGTVMLLTGRQHEALDEIRRSPPNYLRDMREIMALISLNAGDEADSAIVEFTESTGHWASLGTACINSWRGNVDDAFVSLEAAFEQRDISLAYLLTGPCLENLEDDPRWDALLDRMDLLDAYLAMKEREAAAGS
jgi:tetratricopeptide (TPR) repeat protein